MGMDVFGRNPDDPKGEYFRANVWYWRPLWGYVEDMHPDIAAKVPYAHSNDGDGLDDINARLLAIRIKEDILQGTAEKYADEQAEFIEGLADETCSLCNGSGSRVWPEGITQEWIDECNGCNGCRGEGTVRPFQASYHFDVDLLNEFADFMFHSGGFNIH